MGTGIFQSYPLGGRAELIPVGVFLPGPGGSYVALPQLRCLRIEDHEGPRPPTASFRWIVSDRPHWDYPDGFEDVLPVASVGRGVLRPDDEVFVAALTPRGDLRWLFAGYVLSPGLDLSDRGQGIVFDAVGRPVRCWDSPLRGSFWRAADKPTEEITDQPTDLPARFNPQGLPCFSVPDYDKSVGPGNRGRRGSFLDPAARIDPAERIQVHLAAAIRYLAWAGNEEEIYVVNPTPDEIDSSCTVIVPTGANPIDPDGPDSFQAVSPWVPDTTVSDLPVFEAIDRVLSRLGWGFSFRLRSSAAGDPEYTWDCYPLQSPEPRRVKVVGIQPAARPNPLDRGRTNVKGAGIGRSGSSIVNQYRVTASPTEVEVGLVLSPMFPIDPDDATTANKAKLRRTNPDPAHDYRKYRLWGVDECGEGHAEPGVDGWDWIEGDTGDLFPLYELGVKVARRRTIGQNLFSLGPEGVPRRAELALLRGYDGPPGVWDGTGEVIPIKTDFRADEDSLSIWLTMEDASVLYVGKIDDIAGLDGGKLPQVDWLALTANASKRFRFLLTCTVRMDSHPEVIAARTSASPTRFIVERNVQAEDRHGQRLVHPSSRFFDSAPALDPEDDDPSGVAVVRRLADGVQPELAARRAATQVGPFGRRLDIPRLINTIQPGDVIRRIEGRNLDLRADAAGSTSAPLLPRVVSRVYEFDDGQRTVLSLSSELPEDRGY